MATNPGISTPQFTTKSTPFNAAMAPVATGLGNSAISHLPAPKGDPEIPAYLRDTYYWAYLDPRAVRFFDHEWVVSIILWGQHRRLQKAAFKAIEPGSKVLQPAAVYGNFSPNLAAHIGPWGSLTVADVAPVQVARSRAALADFPNAIITQADARQPGGGPFDVVCSYFLMHELPDDAKREVMAALLSKIGKGGKVIFVDYHKPHWAHPLKPITSTIFDALEPFAKGLWRHELRDFATQPGRFEWTKRTFFGGLFQLVTATRGEHLGKPHSNNE